jgi:hypothetical protein
MNKIIAKYVSDYDSEKRDGSGRVFCPFCGEAARAREVEEYTEEGSDRSLELCTDCREGFERDIGLEFENDVLAKPIFSQVWDEAPAQEEEETGLNEKTAEQVAKALGGNAWQSGGGIWLVLLRRKDGTLVVISDEAIGEYSSEAAFDAGSAGKTILLV